MSEGLNDIKLTEEKPMEHQNAQHETSFYNAKDTDAFLPTKPNDKAGSGDDDIESSGPTADKEDNKFHGLTREELEQFSADPKWVKIRWVLFVILLVGWVALLLAAIVIVVVEPKCPPTPDLSWYQDGVVYGVDVEKFKDSNGDGIGDVAGVEQQLDHFKDLSVKSVLLKNVLDTDDQSLLRPSVGSSDDLQKLADTFKGIRVVLELVLSSSTADALEDVVRSWTKVGAGGFVLSTEGNYGESAATVFTIQTILDEEFNKKDDRARVVIAGKGVEESDNLRAQVVMSNSTCPKDMTPWECKRDTLLQLALSNNVPTANALGETDEVSPWKILQADVCSSEGVCDLVLQLTLPGTPNVQYGAEIGLTDQPRGYMLWDDSLTNGFTSNQSWTNPNPQADVDSVLAQRAAGYEGTPVYTVFKELAAARADEPSLKWGDFVIQDFGGEVLAFVRNATGHAPVVVAVNQGEDRAGSLLFGEYSFGEVLVTSGVDMNMDDPIDLSAVYLPTGGAVVARMRMPEPEK